MSQPLVQPPDDWIVNPEATDTPPAPKVLRVGFTAGIIEGSEELIFRLHGSTPGIMELRGLVEYARLLVEQSLQSTAPHSDTAQMRNQLKEIKDTLDKLPKA